MDGPVSFLIVEGEEGRGWAGDGQRVGIGIGIGTGRDG